MLIHRLTGRKLARIGAILLFAGLVVADLLVAQVVFQTNPPETQSIIPMKSYRLFLPMLVRVEIQADDITAPTPEPALQPTPSDQKTYVVKSGDTLYGIAKSFGISVPDLVAANQLDITEFIMPGQKLLIPTPQP